MSETEAIVADRLSTGASIDEIASERGVSVVTVRNQIKSAQAKTGVSRQAELVSLVLRSTHF
ncbi:helix-turn-helix transcriptional regulator [Pelagibius sp. Alg239-R121]|uniref:helix-turn-helix transcriptional regulator n=1 Tax=Pelagibius sp. Alg239-R121 TaxID=2993448 RepID=UPI0034611526